MTGPQRDLERPAGLAARLARSPWPGAVAVGLLALAWFGFDLAHGSYHVDESAYGTQAYFFGLLAEGRWDDPLWLDYPALDLPPLPKYLIGAALAVGAFRTPGPADAWAWYQDTSKRFDTNQPGALTAARVPMVLVGAIGCVAVYGLGVLAAGRRVGGLSALLLAADPLYRLHARRAMSDVPCEAFLLAGLFFALWAWKRVLDGRTGAGAWLSGDAAGVCAGLSLLSKLSGALALMVMAAWVVLAAAVRPGWGRVVRAGLVLASAVVVSALTFVALNPFLTAHPPGSLPPAVAGVERLSMPERAQRMAELRLDVATGQKKLFPHNAMHTAWDKVSVTAVQGFGRFGPFGPALSDSTKRYDWSQDRGALLWLPWVAAGVVWAAGRGRAQARAGDPPTAWAVLIHFAVALGVVTAYLPLAWDRYFLPLQAPSALLASGAAVALLDGLARALVRRPTGG
jgi:4-amino-4-deoxy-L-arabinose transferase-like glycosyltransferase